MSLQIGKFGILIKRRTLAQGLVAIALCILSYYVILYVSPFDPHSSYQVDENLKWASFIKECGKRVPAE